MNRFALGLQSLRSDTDRVLLIGDLLRRREPTARFSTSEIRASLLELNVPPPTNISSCLARLRDRGHAMRHPDGLWAITPLGIEAVGSIGEQMSLGDQTILAAEGAVFAHVEHTVIPSWAAPPRWQTGIARFHEKYSFDESVFCMTRFPGSPERDSPLIRAIEVCREVLSGYGLKLHLASDMAIDDDLLSNVGAYMWACKYGLGLVENLAGFGVNYNVAIELGAMIMTGRRCAILKDESVSGLPTDLSGQIYKSVVLVQDDSVAYAAEEWVVQDLSIVLESQ